MKAKLLSIILAATMLIPTTANAKTTPYYTMKGTVHNFTYTQTYSDGTTIKGKGFDIYTTDGNIWEMNDTDYHFAENATVKVKFHNNNTPKDKTDDRIISVKKAN